MASASTDDKRLYCKSGLTVIMEDSCLHTILIEVCCQVECGINAGGYRELLSSNCVTFCKLVYAPLTFILTLTGLFYDMMTERL